MLDGVGPGRSKGREKRGKEKGHGATEHIGPGERGRKVCDATNGSPRGIAGLTTADGRFSILMPHPERVFRSVQMSWHPPEWGEDSPWMRMFRNARAWLG